MYICFREKYIFWHHLVHLNIAFIGKFLSTEVAGFGITTT